MTLTNRMKRLESVLELKEEQDCACLGAKSVEFWQQLVDGHTLNSIGEPTRTGPPAELVCATCGKPKSIIAIEWTTLRAEDLEPVWSE